jgi:hypothetical protein
VDTCQYHACDSWRHEQRFDIHGCARAIILSPEAKLNAVPIHAPRRGAGLFRRNPDGALRFPAATFEVIPHISITIGRAFSPFDGVSTLI